MSDAVGLMPGRSRYLPWLVLALILGIVAAAILLTMFHLRRALRQQIVAQDGIALYASTFVKPALLDGLGPELESDSTLLFAALAEQMFDAATKRGALAVRLYDQAGELQMAAPIPGPRRELTTNEIAALVQGETLSSFEAKMDMEELGVESGAGPALITLVPLLGKSGLLGAAEFVLNGEKVAQRFRALDRDLWRYSVMIFLIGGGLTALSLGWTFARLARTQRLLTERTQKLLRANHELTLAAKTSAVGAITAHLIHDLKSPLFGLQNFVSARGSEDEEDWENAADAAERMQKLIAEVVRILQEEKTSECYEISVEELFDLLRNKVIAETKEKEIELVVGSTLSDAISNREANILLLVLTNLARNAIQATPPGGQVLVGAHRTPDGVRFEVSDTGPGLPETSLKTLFTPSRSTKAGGTGLGLALSKQLANHLGADLVLKQTSHEGTTFAVHVPERIFAAPQVPR